MKQGRYIVIGAILLVVLFIAYKLITFQIFDNELRFIDKIPVANANYSVSIYQFPPSATLDGAIQVHLMQNQTGEKRLYKNYDRYTDLVFAKVIKDSLLSIGLMNSNSAHTDTVEIKLPKSY